jgi:hypothetical protein
MEAACGAAFSRALSSPAFKFVIPFQSANIPLLPQQNVVPLWAYKKMLAEQR